MDRGKVTKKKSKFAIFSVVCSALYVALCTGIMIVLDNYTDLQNYVSWVLGWCMSMIYVVHIFIRR